MGRIGKIKKWKKILMVGSVMFFSGTVSLAMASPEQERVYLLQLLHQIDAMHTTLLEAAREQSPDTRVQFHYTAYRDAQGQSHNGVWEDLQRIRSGIEEKLNPAAVEPRTLPPISGDYVDAQTTAGE